MVEEASRERRGSLKKCPCHHLAGTCVAIVKQMCFIDNGCEFEKTRKNTQNKTCCCVFFMVCICILDFLICVSFSAFQRLSQAFLCVSQLLTS